MTDRYENIRRALAMGPTPGPWVAIQNPEWPNAKYGITHDPSKDWVEAVNSGVASVNGEANARLIAACDSDTAQALLDERDALEAEIERLRGALEECHSLSVERWRRLLAAEAENERLRKALEEIRSRS